MIPLVSGQTIFEQKTESLKADLESMMLDIDGQVNLVRPHFGLIRSHWCLHSGASLSWADFDGDGIEDMLCDDDKGTHWVILSNGRGGIKKEIGMHTIGWCSGGTTHWADINGDGKADMLCEYEDGSHYGYINGSPGRAGQKIVSGTILLDKKYCYKGNFKWVDMNGNGKADMVCDYPGSGSHWSQYSVGDGTFINMGSLENKFCHGDDVVNYADLNGDGAKDIICSHDDGEHHAVFLDGQGDNLYRKNPPHVKDFCKGHPENVQFADINGDGKEDIVCSFGGRHQARLSVGDGTFTDFLEWNSNWCSQYGAVVNWVDITGDGIAEMVCFD